MRRRRKVGRAYDMALEVARVLPPRAEVLDVGCGNGFIAHHLQSMLGTTVVGLDVGAGTAARINYVPYDGRHFPVRDQSFDAVLLCYVLHHAQDPRLVLNEVNRVLRDGGLAIIYEDIPSMWWDRVVCWTHDRQWRGRTGPCTFQAEQDWRRMFSLAGFEVVKERALSRWRNLAHPVARQFFVIRATEPSAEAPGRGSQPSAVGAFDPALPHSVLPAVKAPQVAYSSTGNQTDSTLRLSSRP